MVNDVQQEILATLAYFDNFRYPLTQKEIFLFLPVQCTKDVLQHELSELLLSGHVYRVQQYYSLVKDEQYARRRNEGYSKAIKLIDTGKRVAALLSHFPFVKGVAISGSLSKYFAEDDADIDLFIITSHNRVWLARTFTHLLKKLSYLFNKQHYLCMNYYIDEGKLDIVEKNIFTATEIVTLMPLQGTKAFDDFFKTNNWTAKFLPNHFMRIYREKDIGSNPLKLLLETCFKGKWGNTLDNYLMNITAKRWQQKTRSGQLNDHGYVMSMTAHKHYSKPDPAGFPIKLLAKHQEKLLQLQQLHAMKSAGEAR
ncbi:hypothetical protein [Pinibacter aurantiacus]|uniref:Nucleotidyltransferase domain-containing protein n=1 Tax=Pinibacter aurantiacus TaxID=2851599 RepID=A0A9E2W9S5_9BACT|nr:hypothetical protein [Pinibacter aurantiacus]MBV4360152.1 hypothetical protein [Pinibacter aurantiacus]